MLRRKDVVSFPKIEIQIREGTINCNSCASESNNENSNSNLEIIYISDSSFFFSPEFSNKSLILMLYFLDTRKCAIGWKIIEGTGTLRSFRMFYIRSGLIHLQDLHLYRIFSFSKIFQGAHHSAVQALSMRAG